VPAPTRTTIYFWNARRLPQRITVTGNAKHFPAAWVGTQIVTARQFLDAVDW
jgi:hypothetical protein